MKIVFIKGFIFFKNGINQYKYFSLNSHYTIGSQVTDYVGNKIYKNNGGGQPLLYQISHDEGRIVNGIYEYNITDHNKDLRVAFKDSLGIAKIVQSNAYGVWGEDLPTLKYINTPKINNFGFLNREFQPETGYTDLVNRQFDNITGRFTSQDPVIEGQEHLSLYQYGWNNPVLKPDPNGLEPCCGAVGEFVMGFTHAFNENVSPVPGTSLVNQDGGRNYSNGVKFGHRAALLVGALEVGGGGLGVGGSGVVELASGGLASPAAIPVGLASGAAIVHGLATVRSAWKNLNSEGEKTHGNKLDDKPAEGYSLRDKSTREVKKYGETTRGEDKFGEGKQKRYSKKELDEKGVDYKKETNGTKKEMHKWQNDKIKDHKQNNDGKRPDLNKSDY